MYLLSIDEVLYMTTAVQEMRFDMVVTVASGLALVAYMLGLFLNPLPAAALGGVLIIVGTVMFVPRKAWFSGSVLGIGAVILAGTLVPRFVVEFTTVNDEMPLTVGLSAAVLVGTFVTLHHAAFQPHTSRTA